MDATARKSGAPRPRVLVAEDDDALRALLVRALEAAGLRPVELEDGLEFQDYLELVNRRAAREHQPDAILTDVRMPGRSGLDVVRQARAVGLTCPVVVLTAFPDPEVYEAAAALGRTVVLGKPADLDHVAREVCRVLA